MGSAGCSLRWKQAGSVSCGTSLSGRNTGWLPQHTRLKTPAAMTFTVGSKNEKHPNGWEIRERHVTPGHPAVQAAAAQTPSGACEGHHWNPQSPGPPGWPSPSLNEEDFQEKLHLSNNLRAIWPVHWDTCHSWHTYIWVFQSNNRVDIELAHQWDIWNDKLKGQLKKRWMHNLCLRLLGDVYLLVLVSNTQSCHNLSYPVGAQSPLAPWKQKICPHYFYYGCNHYY